MWSCNNQVKPYALLVSFSVLSIVSLTGCGGSFSLPTSGDEIRYQHAVAKLNEKAQTYMDSGRTLDAVARLESALDLMPDEFQTMNNLAVAYYNAQRFDQAIATYDKLLTLKAAEEKAGVYLKSEGVAYEALGDKQLQSIAEANLPANGKAAKDIQAKAIETFEKAVATYKKALDSGAGLAKDDTDPQSTHSLHAQIKVIEEQIGRIRSGETG